MPEISLRGEKYIGIFNGDKREVDETKDGINYHHEWYDGAGFIRRFNNKNRSNSKKYFFRFLVREDSCKSTLKETLEELAVNFGSQDSFLELISFRIKESESGNVISKIYLPK